MSKNEQHFDRNACWASLIFLFVAILTPNVKIFFIVSFLYFAWLTINYSFAKAMIYGSLIIGFFAVSQSHQVLVVPRASIVSGQYLEGRHLGWSISPGLMIALVGSGGFYWWQRQFEKKLKLLLHEKIILIMAGWGLLAAWYSALMPGLSTFYVISGLIGSIWLAYLLVFSLNLTPSAWRKIIQTIFQLIIILILYESLIVFLQTLYQGPIGLLIENTKIAPVFGLGADEKTGGFRPFGLSFHPNGLANQHLVLLSSLLLLKSHLGKQRAFWRKLFKLAVTTSSIVIILSLSRAAFIALGIGVGIALLRHPNWFKQAKYFVKQEIDKVQLHHKLLIILLGLFLIFKFSDRMLNSVYAFSSEGGVSTRLVQYQEAWAVFLHSPFFGIGDGMFIPTSFQLFPKGVMTYFPENVHNGFFLLLVERGAVGLFLSLSFIYLLLKSVAASSLSRVSKTMIYSGIVASLCMMIFHPERNFMSLLVSISIALLHYEKNRSTKNTSKN